jgi:hypothetical protein
LSIKAKQVAGVTALVVLVVAGMIAVQIASLTQLRIDETKSRAATLKELMLDRAAGVVREAERPILRGSAQRRRHAVDLESAVTSQPEANTILYARSSLAALPWRTHAGLKASRRPLETCRSIVGRLDQLRFVNQERRYELREDAPGRHRFRRDSDGVSTCSYARPSSRRSRTSYGGHRAGD